MSKFKIQIQILRQQWLSQQSEIILTLTFRVPKKRRLSLDAEHSLRESVCVARMLSATVHIHQ